MELFNYNMWLRQNFANENDPIINGNLFADNFKDKDGKIN